MSAFAPPEEDAGALGGASDTLGRVSGDLGGDRRSTTNAVTGAIADWTGPRSEAFDRAGGGVQVQLRLAEDGCADVATVLHDYARAVTAARDDIADLHAQWTTVQASLDQIRPATDPAGDTASLLRRHQQGLAEQADEVRSALAKKAAAFAARIDAVTNRVAPVSSSLTPAEILRQVHAALGSELPQNPSIADALAALVGARRAVPAGAVLDDGTVAWSLADDLPTVPTAGSEPAGVHLWWSSLNPTQQEALLRSDPSGLGNLDGIPIVDRDAANRRVLPAELASLKAELADLGPEPSMAGDGHFSFDQGNPAWVEWTKEHDDLVQRIKGIEAIRQRLASDVTPPYYLIGFQPRVGNGRAVVSQGDPDLAADTSAFVTGTTTKLGGIGTDLDRSAMMRRSAVRKGADPASLATITWYGYDAPQTLPQAADLHWAEDGAPILDRFATGLRVTHRGEKPSHTTVVAHSYGTTTVGWAASHGHTLDVDDVVMVASPGAGVGHGWLGDDGTTVSSLHLGGPSTGHVYATRSHDDPIRIATDTHLGIDPTRSGFGAIVFGSDPEGGHSHYWDHLDSHAVSGMGLVIAGRGHEVPPPNAAEDVHPPRDVTLPTGT